MRLNVICWNTVKEVPELITDMWQPHNFLEDCEEMLLDISKEEKYARGYIIDFLDGKPMVLSELKDGVITRYNR